LNRLTALSEADDVTLEDVAEFVCTQRRGHPRRKGADVVGTLAHTLAGADGDVGGATTPNYGFVIRSRVRFPHPAPPPRTERGVGRD